MKTPMFDPEALSTMVANATSRQGEQLRKGVAQATLAALQGRELTLKNIRGVLKQVAEAASAGVAKNAVAGVDPEALLDKAVGGMDEAVLKAVEAQRTALTTLAAQGADLRDKHLGKALADLEKMEDGMFSALKKAAAAGPMAEAWAPVLQKMQAGGTAAGAQAAAVAEQFETMATQMQVQVRGARAASMKAAQALVEGYAAMASGVLLGMSEALQAGAAAKKAPRK
jgi:hypothetical protein